MLQGGEQSTWRPAEWREAFERRDEDGFESGFPY